MTSITVDEYEVPIRLYYTKEHEWIKIESDNNARVGISDYAQKSLHEVVYVDLPDVGSTVDQMDPIGTVESVKAVSEIYAPLSGEINKVNEKLRDSPELVNESPYDNGWIAVIKSKALYEELKILMTPKQYAEYLRQLLREPE